MLLLEISYGPSSVNAVLQNINSQDLSSAPFYYSFSKWCGCRQGTQPPQGAVAKLSNVPKIFLSFF